MTYWTRGPLSHVTTRMVLHLCQLPSHSYIVFWLLEQKHSPTCLDFWWQSGNMLFYTHKSCQDFKPRWRRCTCFSVLFFFCVVWLSRSALYHMCSFATFFYFPFRPRGHLDWYWRLYSIQPFPISLTLYSPSIFGDGKIDVVDLFL